MKTLHLTNYWHERSGGIATFYRQLLEAANRNSHRMVLIVPGAEDELQELGDHCRIYKIAAPASPLNPEYRTIYPSEFLLPGSKVQKILIAERPDLVEICDKYSLIHLGPILRMQLARDLDFRPAVVGLSCERMDENFAAYLSRAWWARMFVRLYMRFVYLPAFDHHIANSDNTAEELKNVDRGLIVQRGTWVRPMGVDIEHFSPKMKSLDVRRELLSLVGSSDCTLLLYAGRLVPEKNLDLLIGTLAELDKAGCFRLLVVGDGIARDSLAGAAQERVPGKVVFLGHLSDREQLARIYANCDFFVHPNPTEPFGIAPLEAMASGLPLIAPDRGGVTSYANLSNAYLAPATPQEFAKAILSAHSDAVETSRRARQARITAEALAWPQVCDSFLHLYEQIWRLHLGQLTIAAAAPAFVSRPVTAGQTHRLRAASNFAQAIFSAYAWLNRTAHADGFRNERRYPTQGHTIRMKIRCLLLFLLALLPFLAAAENGALHPATNITVDQIVARLEANNRRRQQELQSYTGQREYHLLYTGFPGKREADLVVEVKYDAPDNKDFSVVSETGSHLIINRVFKKLLDTEKEAADVKSQARTAVSKQNYNFELLGQEDLEGRPSYVLRVEPKTDNKLLYRGKIWVDAADFAVAKIEAEPAKRPSFWISKTTVHHTYKKIGDFWLPAQNESNTDVRLGGHAVLSIHYKDYKVIVATKPPGSAPQDPQLTRESLSLSDRESVPEN